MKRLPDRIAGVPPRSRSACLHVTRATLVFALAVATLALLPRVHAEVVINPIAWGLNPGDTFRLVVVTAGSTTGSSTSIAAYDAFVNTQGLSGITYGGSSLNWQAIAQTPSSSPVSDGSRYSSQANATRTYNLNGIQVSSTTNGSAFWWTTGFNQHMAAIDWTINAGGSLAQVNGSQLVWTGFDIDGSVATANNYQQSGFPIGSVTAALGQTVAYTAYDFGSSQTRPATLYPYVGRAGAAANGWSAIGNEPLASSYPMYAMSELITVTAVPEPNGAALAGIGAALVGLLWRRSRRATGQR